MNNAPKSTSGATTPTSPPGSPILAARRPPPSIPPRSPLTVRKDLQLPTITTTTPTNDTNTNNDQTTQAQSTASATQTTETTVTIRSFRFVTLYPNLCNFERMLVPYLTHSTSTAACVS